jgi:hypothetical protein
MRGPIAAVRNAALRLMPEAALLRGVHRIYRWNPA